MSDAEWKPTGTLAGILPNQWFRYGERGEKVGMLLSLDKCMMCCALLEGGALRRGFLNLDTPVDGQAAGLVTVTLTPLI